MSNPADDLGCKLWLAAYVKNPNDFLAAAWAHSGFTIWQSSSTGTVPGVEKTPGGPQCGVRPRRAQGRQRRAEEAADVTREGLEHGVRASVASGPAQRARDSRNERRGLNLR
jgi:hypothetical protein